MDRATITRWLPTGVKRRLRPVIAPAAYALERRRLDRLYADFVRRGDLVFDIGAAEGHHSASFRRLGARVVAVEPQPRFVQVLERRFASDDRVSVDPRGAGAGSGRLELAVSIGDPELTTFALDRMKAGRYRDRSWEERVEVEVTTLDALIETHGAPAFVKIDVEGFEPEVLAGLSKAPAALSFEFGTDRLDAVPVCVDRIAALGRFEFNHSWARRHELDAGGWVDGNALLERLRSVGATNRHGGGDVFARAVGLVGDEGAERGVGR